MERPKRIKNGKVLVYTFLVLLSMGLFVYLDYKDITILYDNTYSIFLSKASYSEIWHITASDVHPPLYYWGLKAFTSLFGESLFVFRLFSTLGLFAIVLLGCFPIRKLFGDKIAVSFIILITIFPVSQYLATEIRMYSWTMFFVLVSALLAFRIYMNGKLIYWILFFLSGICAAYLHNYGLLSISGIFLILSVFLIKQKGQWKGIFICAVLFFLAYLPWLFQLMHQMEMVSDDYWIKPLTLNDLYLHLYYFYSPKEIWLPFTYFSKVQMMIGLILIMALQLFLTLTVLISGFKERDRSVDYLILSFLVFIIPVIVGLIISITYLPVLVTRYMTCSFGLFLLGLAIVLVKSFDRYRWLTISFFLLLSVDGGIRLFSGLKYYSRTRIAYQDIVNFAGKNTDGQTTFVVNDFSYHVMPRLQLIAPGNQYQVLMTDSTNIDFRPFVFDQVKSLPDREFILVHQERDAIHEDFLRYRKILDSRYAITDSLHATDIYLYRIQMVCR